MVFFLQEFHSLALHTKKSWLLGFGVVFLCVFVLPVSFKLLMLEGRGERIYKQKETVRTMYAGHIRAYRAFEVSRLKIEIEELANSWHDSREFAATASFQCCVAYIHSPVYFAFQ